jgi:ATP-dependent Clp protease ATP-binding subunit ClpC
MDVLRAHFRPEFLNRIDDIIVFHALSRPEIRSTVELQLERAKRAAHGQGIELDTDGSVIDHLAVVGFRPEFGAREFRRLLRSELERQLAHAMLANGIHEGDRVLARWDPARQKIVFEPKAAAPATRHDDGAGAADAVEEDDRESFPASVRASGSVGR